MKRLLPVLLPSLAMLILFAGCEKEKTRTYTYTYRMMIPVFESKAVVYNSVKSEPAQQLQQAGKIFVIGDYLFISEPDKGVHVYDNSNPVTPRAISFINIPGNIDIAVKDHYLYADLYSDLVTIDITDPLNATVVDTLSNFFSHKFYDNSWNYYPDKFVIKYIEKDTTVEVDDDAGVYQLFGGCAACSFAPDSKIGQPKATYSPGVAGSMARMVIVKNFLYGVTTSSLLPVDLQNPAAPERKSESYISWSIETVYPFKNRLFIGSSDGMFIYNIDNPAMPVQEGSFTHARACDPVVTDGDYAYVTLRSGDACAGFANQLDIIDVKNVSEPLLVKSYPLFNPHGVGKDANLLFVCDGSDGIKAFDVSDVLDIKLVDHISDVDAYDVIPWRNKLIVSTRAGVLQYDYSDPRNIKLLSTIKTR